MNSSSDPLFTRRAVDPTGPEIAKLIESADAFICAAGFEERAARVPFAVNVPRNPMVIRYDSGPSENNTAFSRFSNHLSGIPGFDYCTLDLARPERFEGACDQAIQKLRTFEFGQIVIDVSGLLNVAICILVTKIRRAFPTSNVTILYTEAREYFPRFRDFRRIKSIASRQRKDQFPEYLSSHAVSMCMPEMFSGVTLGHHDTCLIVFAGYEPHRTTCVIEATNPSKLVLAYGEPERPDLKWRLELSQIMHSGAYGQLNRTEEISRTFDVAANVKLVLEYYEHLYDDHVLCVSPINSKIQAVASALAWEQYPDIQLAFPMPTEYLPKRFSVEAGKTFRIDLGLARGASLFL